MDDRGRQSSNAATSAIVISASSVWPAVLPSILPAPGSYSAPACCAAVLCISSTTMARLTATTTNASAETQRKGTDLRRAALESAAAFSGHFDASRSSAADFAAIHSSTSTEFTDVARYFELAFAACRQSPEAAAASSCEGGLGSVPASFAEIRRTCVPAVQERF
jgi:hypothetical protein